jgi:hypothetical protein
MAGFGDDRILDAMLNANPFRYIQQRIQFTIIDPNRQKSYIEFGYDTFNDCGTHWKSGNDLRFFRDNFSIRDGLALLSLDHGKYTLEWCDKPNQTINDILSYSFSGCPICQIIIDHTHLPSAPPNSSITNIQ